MSSSLSTHANSSSPRLRPVHVIIALAIVSVVTYLFYASMASQTPPVNFSVGISDERTKASFDVDSAKVPVNSQQSNLPSTPQGDGPSSQDSDDPNPHHMDRDESTPTKKTGTYRPNENPAERGSFVSSEDEEHEGFMSSIEIDHEKHQRPRKHASPNPPLTDPEGNPMDFVICVSHTHCSVHLTTALINKFYNPRYIFFIVKDTGHCPTIESWDTNVICVDENKLLPKGFGTKDIRSMIEALDDPIYKEKHIVASAYDRAGWYLLQYLNFGIGMYLKGISEHYVVWDSDIIPLESRRTFFNDKGEAIFYTQRNHGLPEITHGYHKSFEHLFGFRITHPPGQNVPEDDAKSSITWVAHQMIFKREYVTEMMRYIENNRGVDKDSWMVESTKIWLQSDMKPYRMFGFADYDMYGSWIHQKHPDKLEVLLKSYELWELFERAPGYEWGTCCPPRSIYNEKLKDGSHYFLNEVHKSDPKCKDSLNTYGVKEIPEEYADLFPKR